MTVRQVIIGTMLGAAALAVMLHRLPKSLNSGLKFQAKHDSKSSSMGQRTTKKKVTLARLSLSKTYN